MVLSARKLVLTLVSAIAITGGAHAGDALAAGPGRDGGVSSAFAGETRPDERDWQRLESSHWVREGAEDAKRVVYVFLDPQCPYCNLLWRASQPYVRAGLEVRTVVVAYLTPRSTRQAAAILGAEDPQAMLTRHENAYRNGGIRPVRITDEGKQAVDANNALFTELDIPATPAIYYRDKDGRVKRVIGLPGLSTLASEVFRMPVLPQSDPALARLQHHR